MLSLIVACLALGFDEGGERPCLIVVVGAPGAPEYDDPFRRASLRWQAAARQGGAEVVRIGPVEGATEKDAPGTPDDREKLRQTLARKAAEPGLGPVWLVLVGHGSWDGKVAKFNLRGPDVSDVDLAAWLEPMARPVAVIDGSFLSRLSKPGRVIVTATKSGDEQNFARLGQYLAEAVADPTADLDKDGQVSLLEAFVTASARVEEFYQSKNRLATEHPLIDDNGDKLGTPADWFRGVRATRKASSGAAVDGPRAHQFHLVPSPVEKSLPPATRRRRDELEIMIAALRERKQSLGEDAYYVQLEPLMLELARLYDTTPTPR
jgi:hypothetical protein